MIMKLCIPFVLSLLLTNCSQTSGNSLSSWDTSTWLVQLGVDSTPTGSSSSLRDECTSVAVDSSGNVYCGGSTESNLGEINGGGSDVFVMKLDSSGGIVWITQLGGATTVPGGDTSAEDLCLGIAVDSGGNVYCGGSTESNLGEINGGGSDAFVMKLNSSGAIEWITQFGGTTAVPGGDTSKSDGCEGVSVDSSGNVYCGGYTSGSLGETNGGTADIFMTKLDSSGTVMWIKQLGGATTIPGGVPSGGEGCNSVAVDNSGYVYCGGTSTGNLGEVQGGSGDAVVGKFSSSSGALQWVTQLGATTVVPGGDTSRQDNCNSVAVDSSGNVYCGGFTGGALGETNGGGFDAFVMKVNSSGVLQWVTQLGATTVVPGGDTSNKESCVGVAYRNENIYCAGYTLSNFGESNAGDRDVFVLKLKDGASGGF